jgi:ABC-type transport system involved in multi-copper enzyme maturation permease subunit
MNVTLLGACIVILLVQLLAALPWATVVGLIPGRQLRSGGFWIVLAGVGVGLGVLLGLYLTSNNDTMVLGRWGRFLFAVFHLQLGLDLFVLVFSVMLRVWPKGGAVALASFQEGLRQPKFWLLLIAGFAVMALSSIIPFFTFGEDIKLLKELCFVFTMLLPAIFGVLAAALSITDEIEGRTAVTLMSKPIQRRDFLLGKFAGIALAALSMTIVLGWWLVWIVLFKEMIDPPITREVAPDPAWVTQAKDAIGQGSIADLIRGMLLWINDAGEALPGLTIGYCQVMVLTALSVALATRLPLLANLVACMIVYFLGHLTSILTEVTASGHPLIHVLAQIIDTIFPGLDLFDAGPAVIRDVPLPFFQYTTYAGQVTIYGLVYTAIALLLGLVLFEDRDLA